MSKSDLEKQSTSLLTRIIVCAGLNVFLFLGLGFYLLTSQKKIQSSGIKKVDPSLYAEQIEALKLSATFGFILATLPLAICIFFVIKRTRILKELASVEDDLLIGQTVK